MEIRGTYFNGKTSRPYPILIEVDNEHITVLTSDRDSDIPLTIWPLSDCKIESFNASDHVMIKHPDYEGQILEFKGPNAKQMVILVSHDDGFIERGYQSVLTESPLKVIVTSLFILSIVGYSYLVHFSPYVAEKIVTIIPKSVEIKLGESSFEQITQFMEIDSSKTRDLKAFYKACGFQSEYEIDPYVINDDLVNAFAAPGGKVVVYQGIIDRTESWEALAGLLAHETAHVQERHSLRILARSASSYLVISALTGDVSGASGILLENVYQLKELSHSRDHERDADMKGLEYLKDLSIRPEGMEELFQVLLDEQGELPMDGLEIFSTHPLSSNRIRDIGDVINIDSDYQYESRDNPEAHRLWLKLKGLDASSDNEKQ